METGSLNKTDQYLWEHRCVTKRGKQFTRFAIRGILTNPVYMIADETAYQYLKENNVDLFAKRSEFDGEHGIMAYNRTLQRPGKANQIRPMEEWIVAVGKHPGIIAGSDWVRVQAMLDVNKSKSYRRPRSNVALLSGLLRCGECGDYMRPKLTNRKNAEGELIYTYMCSTKERSHGTVCSMKNCNGNTLDAKIIEEIRKLSADKETLTRLLAQTKKVISGSKEGYDAELALLREKHAETEDRIKRLVESLSVASDTSAKYVMEQIDALHQESETQQLRLAELEALTEQSRMLHQEFAFHQEMIESFASAVDSATLEEKRRLLRTIVKKVVWDGKNAYVYLFAEDGEADLPPVEQPMYPLGEDSEWKMNVIFNGMRAVAGPSLRFHDCRCLRERHSDLINTPIFPSPAFSILHFPFSIIQLSLYHPRRIWYTKNVSTHFQRRGAYHELRLYLYIHTAFLNDSADSGTFTDSCGRHRAVHAVCPQAESLPRRGSQAA